MQDFRIKHPLRTALLATLGVGLGMLLIAMASSLSTVITYVGAALFLALGLDPAVSWLQKHRFPRWTAVLTVFAGVLLVLAGFLVTVVPIIVDQVSQFVKQVPDLINNVSSASWVEALQTQIPFLDVRGIYSSVLHSIQNFFGNPSQLQALAGGIWQVVLGIGGGLFAALMVAILVLFFTSTMPKMKAFSVSLFPASRRDRLTGLLDEITHSVGRFVTGQVMLGLVNGILSFIFLSIIRAPFAVVLAFVAFLFSLVPLVGTLTGSTIITLVCLIPGLGSVPTAIAAGIYYLVYMQVESWVISPRIMAHAVQVPAPVVIVAALAGGTLLGVLGALVAIPTAAAIILILKQVVIPRQNQL